MKPKQRLSGPSAQRPGRVRPKRHHQRVPKTPMLPPEAFKEAIVEGAERYLTDAFGISFDVHPKATIEHLIARSVTFTKGSERQQLQAVATAYALYVFDAGSGGDLREGIEQELGIKRIVRADYDPIRFYLERTIFYGRDETKESDRGPNWSYCRDARAIRHLMARGIGPDGLVELASKPGEGLDNWANRRVAARGVADQEDATAASSPEKGDDSVLRVFKDGKVVYQLALKGLSKKLWKEHLRMLKDYVEMTAKAPTPRKSDQNR